MTMLIIFYKIMCIPTNINILLRKLNLWTSITCDFGYLACSLLFLWAVLLGFHAQAPMKIHAKQSVFLETLVHNASVELTTARQVYVVCSFHTLTFSTLTKWIAFCSAAVTDCTHCNNNNGPVVCKRCDSNSKKQVASDGTWRM